MSVTHIPSHVLRLIWGKAAGRCEYHGCNRILWRDDHTKAVFNTAYVAHIYGDSEGGPRYDAMLSPKLAAELSNLMLLCDEHHRLIDIKDVAGHSADRLIAMKEAHEERIELVGGIVADSHSEVVLYGANIGEHGAHITFANAITAMAPLRYPASGRPTSLGLVNSMSVDRTEEYWKQEEAQLRAAVEKKVRPILTSGPHLSVFGFAPQPLLMLLGSLLSDVQDADVYQLHREPKATWAWDSDAKLTGLEFDVTPPSPPTHPVVALVLSISSDIAPERVTRVLGDSVDIWHLRARRIGNDVLRTREDLSRFRSACRAAFHAINMEYHGLTEVHVFPATPVSTAVEVGRVRQPKADVPLVVYDEQRSLGGFVRALRIP